MTIFLLFLLGDFKWLYGVSGETLDLKTPKTVNLRQGEVKRKREEIRYYFHETFDLYEKLFEPLKNEAAYTMRADPLRHPLIFYLGHTAVFFINKLVLARLLDKHINPTFEFESLSPDRA